MLDNAKGKTFLFRATSQEKEREKRSKTPSSNDKRHRPHHCAGLDPEVFAPISKLRVGLKLPRSIAAFYTHDTAGRPLLDNCAGANAGGTMLLWDSVTYAHGLWDYELENTG